MPETLSISYFVNTMFMYVLLLIIQAVFFVFIEYIRPIQTNQKFSREKYTELYIAIIDRVLVMPIGYVAMTYMLGHTLSKVIPHQMFNDSIRQLPVGMQTMLALLLLDFLVYIRHRFTHRFMWSVHSIHHNAHYVNWLTSSRLHPIEILVDLCFSMTVLHIIGFSGEGMDNAVLLLYMFNLFTHTNIRLEWPGPLRYLIGSPNYHRWHHAQNETDAFDKNFSVVFPFIDVIFGTFYHPEGKLPASYGLYHRSDKVLLPPTLWAHLIYPFKRKPVSG